MIVWQLDIQLPMQSVPITTNVVIGIPLRRGELDITCDKVCQWLVAGVWFSPGTRFPPPIKLLHDITEILLKVALNTITYLFINVLQLEIKLSRGEGLTTPHFFACLKPGPVFPMSCQNLFLFSMKWLFILLIQLYWWNYWPSLFKLSFHKFQQNHI